MDELKPVAWLYEKNGKQYFKVIREPWLVGPERNWTEAPLYDPATLLAVIGKALEAAAGACSPHDTWWGANLCHKAILALDPATILAGLTAEAGISMDELAQFMGHDDARTTTKHYARYSPDYLSRVANAITLKA